VGNLVNGDVTRTVQNDPDKIIDAYVPARRSNETQVVVFQQRDFWGPNWNGWEFTVKNDTGRDLSFRGGSNLSERDGVIPKGGTGKVKGAHSIAPGGPANCDFSYFAEKHADIWDSGAITIRSEEDGNVTCLPHSEGKIGVKVSSQPRDGIQEVTFFAR
jgi:hypothetical protein